MVLVINNENPSLMERMGVVTGGSTGQGGLTWMEQ